MKKYLICLLLVVILGCLPLLICCEKSFGSFYTLQEAYDNGMISAQDLKIIADYLNSGSCPQDKLCDDILNSIRKTAVQNMRNASASSNSNVRAEDFEVIYYGTYNGNIAVMIKNVNIQYPAVVEEIVIEVAGISFNYNIPIVIEIWSEN